MKVNLSGLRELSVEFDLVHSPLGNFIEKIITKVLVLNSHLEKLSLSFKGSGLINENMLTYMTEVLESGRIYLKELNLKILDCYGVAANSCLTLFEVIRSQPFTLN